MRRSDGGDELKCTPRKRGKIFFLREFLSRALLSERLGQTTNTEESRLEKSAKKKKKKKIRNRSDEGLAQETSACVSPFHGQSTLWTQFIDYEQPLFSSSVVRDKKTTTRVTKGERRRCCRPRLSRLVFLSLPWLNLKKKRLLAVHSVDNINTLESKSWKLTWKTRWESLGQGSKLRLIRSPMRLKILQSDDQISLWFRFKLLKRVKFK